MMLFIDHKIIIIIILSCPFMKQLDRHKFDNCDNFEKQFFKNKIVAPNILTSDLDFFITCMEFSLCITFSVVFLLSCLSFFKVLAGSYWQPLIAVGWLVKKTDVLSASRSDFYLLSGTFVNIHSVRLMLSVSWFVFSDSWCWQTFLWESTQWVYKKLLFLFSSVKINKIEWVFTRNHNPTKIVSLRPRKTHILYHFMRITSCVLTFTSDQVNITDDSCKRKMISFISVCFRRYSSQCSRIRFLGHR